MELVADPGKDRGDAARLYLDSVGLRAVTPPIHSSDYEAALSNPFVTYLTKRLGLTKRLSYSKACSRGSWAHRALFHDDFTSPLPVEPGSGYSLDLEARLEELRVSCAEMGLTSESRNPILDREVKDAKIAWAQYLGASHIKLPTYGTFREFLSAPYWRVLGRELPVSASFENHKPHIGAIGTLDRLLYHTKHNLLWIVDFKTFDGSPKVRLATCPQEFQTQLYLDIVRHLVRDQSWREKFNLPHDVQLKGMIHVCLRKCPLEFGAKDRDRTFKDFTPTRGKNKGVTRKEPEYHGEPKLDNYLHRILSWYTCTDDYEEQRREFDADPPVNFSFSPIEEVLDPAGYREYNSRLDYLEELYTRTPNPENFLVNPSDLRPYGSLSCWYPFTVAPVSAWPRLIVEESLVRRFRDEHLNAQEDHEEEGRQA